MSMNIRGRVTMIDAGASRVLRRIGTGLAFIGRQSGVRAIGTALSGAAVAAGNFAGQLMSVVGPLAAITGLGAAVGIFAAIQTYTSRTDEMVKFGRTVGLTVNQMRAMDFIAERQGANMATVNSSMTALTKRTGELKAETGGLYTFLKKAGPEWIEQYKAAKTTEQQIALTSKAYEHFEKQGQGMAFAAAAFSRGGAKEMTKFLQGGVEGMRKLTEQARFFRGELGPDAARKVEAYTDEVGNLKQALIGVGDAIGAKTIPMLTPLINQLAVWVATNRELISTKVSEWVTDIAHALRDTDWSAWWQGLMQTRDAVFSFIDAVGGLENVAIGVGVLFAAPFIASLMQVGAALTALAIVAATTPIGQILTGLGLIAFAVWRNWDLFGQNFRSLWNGLSDAVGGFVDWFSGIASGDLSAAADGVLRVFSGIGETAKGAAGLVLSTFQAAARGIDAVFGTELEGALQRFATNAQAFLSDPIGSVEQAWGRLGDYASTALGAAQAKFEAFADWLKSTWVGKLASAISDALAWLGKLSGLSAPTINVPRAETPAGAVRNGQAGAVDPTSAPVQRPATRSGAAGLLQRSSLGGPGAVGGQVVTERREATLRIDVPGGVTTKLANGSPGRPAFDEVKVNRGSAMRGTA